MTLPLQIGLIQNGNIQVGTSLNTVACLLDTTIHLDQEAAHTHKHTNFYDCQVVVNENNCN